MDKMACRLALVGIALLAVAQSVAQVALTSEEALLSFERDTKSLLLQTKSAANALDLARMLVLEKMTENPAPWYADQTNFPLLQNLLVERAQQGWNQPAVTRINFVRHPEDLFYKVKTLRAMWASGYDVGQLQAQAKRVHDAYVRTLTSTYCFLEGLKQAHLLSSAKPGLDTAALSQGIDSIHNLAQQSMQWMHYLRHDPEFESLWISQYFPQNGCWECAMGWFFFYEPGRPIIESFAAWPIQDLGRYFAPYVEQQYRNEIKKAIETQTEQVNPQGGEVVSTSQVTEQPTPEEILNNQPLKELLIALVNLLQDPQYQKDPALLADAIENLLNSPRESENNQPLKNLESQLRGLLEGPGIRTEPGRLKTALETLLRQILRGSAAPKPEPPAPPEPQDQSDEDEDTNSNVRQLRQAILTS